MQSPPTDGLLQLELARAGDQAAIAWVLDTFDRYLGDRARGECAPLDCYMQFPNTSGRLRRYLRDVAVRQAAEHIQGGPWTRALALEAAWHAFMRSSWAATVDQAAPPAELYSAQRIALWWATKRNGGATLSARQLTDILCR